MAASVVQSNFSFYNGDSTTLAFPGAVTAGRLLVAVISSYYSASETGGYVVVTDSLGNTYTQVGTKISSGSISIGIWYAYNCLGGSCTLTINPYSGAGVYFNSDIFEISGIHSATDPLHTHQTGSGSSSTTTTTALAITQPCFIIGAMMTDIYEGSNTITPGTGWTTTVEHENADVTLNSGVIQREETASASYTPTWTLGGSHAWIAKGAAFLLPLAKAPVPPTSARRNMHMITR